MTEEAKFTTVALSADDAAKADKIAAVLGKQIQVKLTRSQVVRRALDDLFLRVCPSEMTDGITENKAAA